MATVHFTITIKLHFFDYSYVDVKSTMLSRFNRLRIIKKFLTVGGPRPYSLLYTSGPGIYDPLVSENVSKFTFSYSKSLLK